MQFPSNCAIHLHSPTSFRLQMVHEGQNRTGRQRFHDHFRLNLTVFGELFALLRDVPKLGSDVRVGEVFYKAGSSEMRQLLRRWGSWTGTGELPRKRGWEQTGFLGPPDSIMYVFTKFQICAAGRVISPNPPSFLSVQYRGEATNLPA